MDLLSWDFKWKVGSCGMLMLLLILSRDKVQSKFLELVARRHQTSMPTQKQSCHVLKNRHLLTLEDLLKLQEDVVSLYLSGRPKIRNIASLHIPYAFRASKSTSKAHPLKYILCCEKFVLMFSSIDVVRYVSWQNFITNHLLSTALLKIRIKSESVFHQLWR